MSQENTKAGREIILQLLGRKETLKVVVNALADTIAGYTKTPVAPGTPSFKEKAPKDAIAVGGIIRFESTDFTMELFLGFSRDLFLMLYENMFMMPVEEINAENHDLAGEILNIAFGAMDPKLREQGFRLVSSLPIIYSGEELAAALRDMDSEALVIPFTANGKSFVVNLFSAGSLKVQWKYPGLKKAG